VIKNWLQQWLKNHSHPAGWQRFLAQSLIVITEMKLLPYYTRTINSNLTQDQVLGKFRSLLNEHSKNNFPEKQGFIGGQIESNKFTIFESSGLKRRAFPVRVYGTYSNEKWKLTFRTNIGMTIIFLLIITIFIYWSLALNTFFFIPLLIVYYITGTFTFSKEANKLEHFIEGELNSN